MRPDLMSDEDNLVFTRRDLLNNLLRGHVHVSA